MSIHAIKAVGLGIGPEVAIRPGSRVHDEIVPGGESADVPVARPTNRAGGLERSAPMLRRLVRGG